MDKNKANLPVEEDEDDKEFMKKNAHIFYKTTAKNIGDGKALINTDQHNGHNGKFTDHLFFSGMYRNNSLNTAPERQRWIEGSKDWMEHLN